jgi:hypothetical protein
MIIYFIEEEMPEGKTRAIKIGQTSNIANRLVSLQNGNARKLNIIHTFEVEDEKANQVEQHLHHCFRNRRMKGEWFAACPYLYDYIKTIKEKGYWTDFDGALKEETEAYKFNELYNQIFKFISETKVYGDIRCIKALANDLEELLSYVKTGRTN